MKRIFSLILAGIIALSTLTACGDDTCNHIGGIATCISLAECSRCGDKYGVKNEERHAGEPTFTTTSDAHISVYECCGTVISEEKAHDWKLGTCQECLYICEHEGGVASCTAKAICEKCGASWGEKDENAHSVEARWISDSLLHKKLYTCCNTYCSTYENYLEAHVWQDGVCTECGYACLHKGGAANCHAKARCDVCGIFYGEIDSTVHSSAVSCVSTSTHHVGTYSCCGIVAINSEPHTFENGRCSVCGYICSHSGGEATCINRAVCVSCGSAYGNKNPSNHANLYESDGSAEPGVYSCCGQYAIG